MYLLNNKKKKLYCYLLVVLKIFLHLRKLFSGFGFGKRKNHFFSLIY